MRTCRIQLSDVRLPFLPNARRSGCIASTHAHLLRMVAIAWGLSFQSQIDSLLLGNHLALAHALCSRPNIEYALVFRRVRTRGGLSISKILDCSERPSQLEPIYWQSIGACLLLVKSIPENMVISSSSGKPLEEYNGISSTKLDAKNATGNSAGWQTLGGSENLQALVGHSWMPPTPSTS